MGKKIWKWTWRIGLGLAALLCAAVLAANLLMVNTVRERIVSPEEAAEFDADCILVLGAQVRDDGTPCAMLQERIDTGVALYQTGAAPCILMSGDHARDDYDEVGAMKREAVAQGVPSEDVFLDHAGLSTYESVVRALRIFGAKRVVVVTQQYHLYRALYVARAYGLDAVGVACDTRVYGGQALREVREWAARFKDWMLTVFSPQAPAWNGPVVALTGNGDDTNQRLA